MYIQSYKQLIVWQKSVDLVEKIYILTSQLPKEEIYGLSSQMRRAAISMPSNIAEGQRRKDLPEFLYFLRIADASSAELETQVIIAKRLYPKLDYSKVDGLLEEVQKMLTVMMNKLELKANSSKLKAKEGFTLIETLFYTLIIAGVLVSATFFSLDILDGQQKARSYQEVQQNARAAMDRIVQEIRAANDLNTTDSTFGAHPGYLSLSHEDSSKNPTIFSVASEKLVIKQGSSATSTLTSDAVRITNLIFTDLSVANRTKNIRISMRVEHVNPDNVTIFTASTTMETSVTIREQEDLP